MMTNTRQSTPKGAGLDPPEPRKEYLQKPITKSRTIAIDSSTVDIDKLILSCLTSKNPRAAAFAKPVLFSSKYHLFLQHCVTYAKDYIREKLGIAYDRSTKPGTDTPSALQHLISELNKNPSLATDQISLQEAHKQVQQSFHQFSETYCVFVLSFKKRHSQSRDRFLFEVVYSVTLEISVQLLQAYNVPFLIVHELERVFKTSLFQSQIHTLFKDPLQLLMFRYLKGLENPIVNKKPGDDDSLWTDFKARLQKASELVVPQQQAWVQDKQQPRKSVVRFTPLSQTLRPSLIDANHHARHSKVNEESRLSKVNEDTRFSIIGDRKKSSEANVVIRSSTYTSRKSRDSISPSIPRQSTSRLASFTPPTPSTTGKSTPYQPSTLDSEKLQIVSQLQQIQKPYICVI